MTEEYRERKGGAKVKFQAYYITLYIPCGGGWCPPILCARKLITLDNISVYLTIPTWFPSSYNLEERKLRSLNETLSDHLAFSNMYLSL